MRQLNLSNKASLGTLLLLAAACKEDEDAVLCLYLSTLQTPPVSQFSATKVNL